MRPNIPSNDGSGSRLAVVSLPANKKFHLQPGFAVQDRRHRNRFRPCGGCNQYRTDEPLGHWRAWVKSAIYAARFITPEWAMILARQTAAGEYKPLEFDPGLLPGATMPTMRVARMAEELT